MGYSVIECPFHLISQWPVESHRRRVGGRATSFPTGANSYEKGGTSQAKPDGVVNGVWEPGRTRASASRLLQRQAHQMKFATRNGKPGNRDTIVGRFLLVEANLQLPSPVYGRPKTKARLRARNFGLWASNPPAVISAISQIAGPEPTWTARAFHLRIRNLCNRRMSYVRRARRTHSLGLVFDRRGLYVHRCVVAYKPFPRTLAGGQARKVRADALIAIQRVQLGHRHHTHHPIHTTLEGLFRTG